MAPFSKSTKASGFPALFAPSRARQQLSAPGRLPRLGEIVFADRVHVVFEVDGVDVLVEPQFDVIDHVEEFPAPRVLLGPSVRDD